MKNFTFKRVSELLLISVLAVGACFTGSASADSSNEYDLKAALTFNLARFTNWPEEHVSNDSGQLSLCVFGDETVQKSFQKINGKQLGDRRILTISLDSPVNTVQCDVLFFSGHDRAWFSRVHAATERLPILTIGEMSGFTQVGGIINMIQKKKKIQFEINPKNIAKSGLSVSSRLMKLCTIVEE